PVPPATPMPLLAVKVALIEPVFPVVESNQPANSKVLVVPVNVMPPVGTTGATAALPTVEPGVPKPITIFPAALSISAMPMFPGFAAVGPAGPGATKLLVPLISRIPTAVPGWLWLLVIGAPKLTVNITTPGFTAAGFVFVQE